MDKPFKVFIISIIIMLLISLIVTYDASKIIITNQKNINPPYAEASNLVIENGKTIVTIQIHNEGFNINITGGYVKIFDTGQIVNISPTNSLSFNVSFPITNTIASFKYVTVQGVLKGYANGNPIYITFSNIVPVNFVISVNLVNFTYQNSTLTLYLKVFSPANITLLNITKLTLVNDNLSSLVAVIPNSPLNITLSAGTNYIEKTFNLKQISGSIIYSSSLQKGYYYYITGYLNAIIYITPPTNSTFYIYHIEYFT